MNWALIGASTIAAEHMIRAIRATGGVPSWLVSSDPARGQAFAQRQDIAQATTDLEAALVDPAVEAVYISTTNEKHRPQALAAIAAGKHVICEKPLAMTVSEARGMVSAAKAAGVVFATNHHLRCAGSHRALRKAVADGEVGRVLSMRVHHAVYLPPHLQGWRIDNPSAGGGVIADITVHDADCVRFILGEDPVSVVAQATASGLGRGVEDSVMSVWAMPSGAMVMAHESFTHAHAGTGIEVHGTEGSLVARGVMTQLPVGEIELVTSKGRHALPYSQHNLYQQAVQEFCAAVAGQGRPAADGQDGVMSLAIAFAVRRAAETGTRQPVIPGDA